MEQVHEFKNLGFIVYENVEGEGDGRKRRAYSGYSEWKDSKHGKLV